MQEPVGIFWYSEDIEFLHSNETRISSCLEKIILDHNKERGCISVIFCSDEHLLSLNKQYLNHDYYTDIVTFPMQKNPLSGDLFISIDRVRDNASKNEIPFETELNRVVIHGVLHLVGYGDKSLEEKTEMRKKEDQYLNELKADA